ncbi:MAG: MBL fold metallo-hydrolase [Clostridiales Family XIII bacterium]|jgi:glyoxylase-like metal-dependent hydrolase (beta-lactamase superfamily II)|nr:MBL fold metallo-hydrolase [Clostridiales Family XIII bacterium]
MGMKIARFMVGMIGTNCYLAWDDETKEAAIFDPAANIPQIAQTIAEESLTLKYVILTHGHGDHIGGVEAVLKANPDAQLVAGEGERQILADARLNFSRDIVGKDLVLSPDIWVKDGDVLKLGKQELKIIATPGHTPGGISILAGEALFSGDTLFHASIGRTDLALGCYEDLINSIRDKLYVLPDDTLVLPGHMEETTIEFEKKHNPFV